MKKRLLAILILTVIATSLIGCVKKEEPKVNEEAIKFKEEYESLNGKKNSKDVEYRSVSISEDNPFIYVDAKDILEKIDNDETFYVYFGDKQCPWCRSVIEKAIESAKKNNIDKIYYVSIWSDDHVEILRDTYTADNKGKLTKTHEGTEEYYKLLKAFDNVLTDYNVTYTNKKKKTVTVSTGEKRIFAPNFIYVEKGEAKELISGISEKQESSTSEFTDEILKEETEKFNAFFKR